MDAASELQERGFVIMPGPEPPERLDLFASAYDAAVDAAISDDVRVGSTSTKVTDFVNRGAEFDRLYVFPPLLEACCRVIGRPFKLSSVNARTLRARTPAQELHVDVAHDSADWPLIGFIFMIDEFRPDNGATRLVPGSHKWMSTPQDGSTWHGHTANTSSGPRRSLQGAFIPEDGRAATDFSARMRPETRSRLSTLALQLTAS